MSFRQYCVREVADAIRIDELRRMRRHTGRRITIHLSDRFSIRVEADGYTRYFIITVRAAHNVYTFFTRLAEINRSRRRQE